MDTKKKWIKNNVYIFLLAAALYACQIQPIIPATGNIGQNAYSASFIQSGKLALAGESTLKNPSPLPSETALIEAATIAAPTTTPTSENLPNPTDTETSPPPPAASATLEAVDTDIPTITITPTASPSITKTSTITITASPAVTSTGTSTTDQVSWSVEVAVPVSNPEVRQEGGQNAVKENIIEEVEQNLADSQVQSDVQIATTNNTVTIYKVILKGEDGIEQMKDTIYDDLASQINLLSGATQLTITGNVTAGEFWPLTLQSNISTGYDWEVVSLDNTTLQVVSENQEQKVEGIGMPAVQTIRFRGVKDGSTTLKLAYRRPWEPTEQVVNKIMIQAGDSLSQATDLTAPEGSAAAQAQENPAPIPTLVVRSPEKQAGAVGLPTSFDWRTQGGITSVKNQASCGSCWAFSTVGVMEGAMKRAGLGDIDLSEQYLVNCNNQGWNCTYGGWWAHDYHINRYISPQTQAGAVLESALPYTATNGSCTQAYSHPYRLSNWYSIAGDTIPTEAQMKQAIYDYGPVSIAICVGSSGSSSFGAYTSGIFQTNETSICGGGVNHAVILTGWDDNTSPPSWILKNSWGTSWGESGYMRIARTISNVGFSANYVLYSGSVPPPANDDFNSAIVISASPYQNIQSTTSATTASDDPTPSCGYGRKNNSVWYRYTAQGAYTISANTIGSSYDTVLSVWSGSRGSLTAIACDDDSGGNYTSNLSFTPTSGQTYYFMASSYSSGGGNLTLNMQQQIPVGVGTYDDTNANIVYSGSWTLYSGTGLGLYNNTLHWTVTNGANAMLTFTGNSITIQNRITYGDVKVEIDGVTYSPITYTAIGNGIGRWTSPSLSSGTHTLVITNTTRSQREIDAIEVLGAPPETMDDSNASITYTGTGWNNYEGLLGGPLNGTGHYTQHPGDVASLTFTGRGVKIVYTGSTNRAPGQVRIDGTLVVTLNQSTSELLWQQEWQSASLANGEHTLTITHVGTSNQYMDLDAIIVIK